MIAKTEISNRMHLTEAVMKLNFSLAASLSAANGERFSTCKGVYYSLHILYALLPPLPSPGAVQHEIIPPPTNAEWESALAAVLDLLSGRTVPLTKNLIKVGCDCLCRVFDACRRASRNTLASTGDPGMEEIKGLDINKTLFELIERVETVSKSTAGGRLAAVMALGRLGNWAGGKSVYSLSNTLCKAITGTDTRLSIGASQALFDMLEGLGSGGRNIPTNTIAKAALKICTDRSAGPHLRKWGARLSAAVVEYGGLKSHSSLLSACIRGMDDDDASLRLAFSTAVGSILASSVKQTSDEGGGMLVGSEGQQQVKKAKRGGEVRRKKLNVIHSPDKRHPPLSESGYTVESGLSLLTAIFFQWSYPSTEREGLSGVATALVVFLRDYRNQHLVTPSAPAVCWLMTILLELLDSDNLPHSKGDAYVVRTVVQYILRNGICAHATETLQLIVSREIINLLDQYNKDSTGELGLGLGSKTLNEHQLQVCLVELSNLVTALGQAAGSLKDILVPCLLPYIRHLGYGVRVEAAVVLASVGKVLPHIGVSIVSSCVSNVDRILTTLYGRRSMNRGDGIFSPELKLDDFRESVLEKTYILKDVSEVVTSEIKKTRLFTLHGYGVTVFLLWQVISETPFGASESLKERVTELGVSLVMAPFIVENPSDKNGHVPPPIGLRCACFRTGWTILCALFQQGGKCGGKYFTLLCPLWERVVSSLKGGTIAKLPTADITLQLVFLGSCLKPLLAFIRCCLGVLYSVPGALSRIVAILDIAINLTCEELKAPSHPEGIVCRTMIKAVLMECFSFLPPGSFPSNCERLFYWGLDHVSAYNDSGIASSLLPEFLNSQDDVLDLTSTTYSEIPISSIPPTTDFESSDTAFGMHAICSGIPVGHQEREAMTLSGPMRLRTNVGYFSSEVTGEQESTYLGFDPSSHNMPDCVISPPTPLHGVHWQCPAAPVASINIRLVDSAVTIIGATFGYVGELEQMKAIDLIIGMLPEAYRPPSYESKKSELLGFGALHAALPSLRTEDVRKSRASRSAVSVHNVATLLLTLLRSLPPYTDSKFNIELPWLSNCRDVLVGLLRYPSPTVRRCAGEGIALLGEKVGNGYVIYLVQELLGILRPSVSHGKKRNIPARTGVIASKLTHRGQPPTTTSFSSTAAAEMDSSSPGLRAGTLFALSATKRRMGRQVNIEWLWAHVRSELAVGGDVPSLTRVWGLHSLAVIVQSSDDIINIATTSPNPSYPSESKLWLESVLELLEVHMLDCWPLELESSLTTVLLELMSAILQVSEGLQLESLGMEPFTASPKLGSREMTSSISWPATPTEWELTVSARLLALWCALSPQDTYGYDAVCLSRQKRGVLEDPRVAEPWLHFAESVVALAPNEVARRSVLPNIVAAALPSVSSVPCFPQTATVVTTAARLLRYLCCLLPGVAAAYKVEVPLFRSFEHMKGGAVFDGTIMWRSLMINRSVEDMCIDYQSAARVIRDVIEAIAEYDNDRDRPLCWILLCRSLTMGTGLEGNTDLFQILPTDWVQACSALRKRAAESVSVLGGVRWQVRHIAVFCCTKALRGIYLAGNIASAGGRAAGMGEGMTLLMDVNKARAEIDASLSAQRAILGQRLWESDYSYISPRYTCLFLEDIVSMAVSAAMASTADSELAELQEGGVILLTTVLLMFGLVLDPDVSEPVFVHVRGNLVRRRALFLEQSVSQISSAVRPALGSSSCPPLVRRGCVLVTVLVGLGLIVDPLVLKRLVRQVMPADLLDTHLSAEKKGITEESRDNHPLMNIVTSVIAAEEHFYRLAVVAELYLLCRDVGVSDQLTMPPVTYLLLLNSPDLPDSVALGLWKALEPYIRIIRPCWLDCCVDAVRLNQGHGQWPSLPHPAKKMGLCYPRTNNPEILHRSLNSLWPAMAAAFAMTSRLDKNDDCVNDLLFIIAASIAELMTSRDAIIHFSISSTPLLPDESADEEGGKAIMSNVVNVLMAIYYALLKPSVFSAMDCDALKQLILFLSVGPYLHPSHPGGSEQLQRASCLALSAIANSPGLKHKANTVNEKDEDHYWLWDYVAAMVTASLNLCPSMVALLPSLARFCPTQRRPGAVVTILELSLRILEEGDDKNGSQALQSLEICLESLEEDKVGQSRELALISLQRVEYLLNTVKYGPVGTPRISREEVSDRNIEMWGHNLSNLVHALGILLKYGGCPQGTVDSNAALKTCLVMAKGWPSRARHALFTSIHHLLQLENGAKLLRFIGGEYMVALRHQVVAAKWILRLLLRVYLVCESKDEDPDLVTTLSEGIQISTMAMNATPSSRRASLCALLMPLFAKLVLVVRGDLAAKIRNLVGQTALHLVTQFPTEFKAGLGGMSDEVRHALEGVLRSVMRESGGPGKVQPPQVSQPSLGGLKGLDLSKYKP